MRTSNNLENKTLPDMYWKLQLVCMKVQAKSSLEPQMGYNQDQIKYLWWINVHYDLFDHLGNYRNIMQFQISSIRERR